MSTPYITGIERQGIEKGIQQGIEQGIEVYARASLRRLLTTLRPATVDD